jgi:hypothetical protein
VTPEKEEKLFSKHPTFFRPEKGLGKTLMGFGFTCNNGWFDILDKLFDAIEVLKPGKDFEVYQVKEKFGGLRIYTTPVSNIILSLIDAVEHESYRTCENCGAAGKPRDTNWIATLCDGCANQRGIS